MMKKVKENVKVRYTAFNEYYTRAFGCFLPNGNSPEFPHIRKHLKRLKVNFSEMKIGGATFFFFPETERKKLPIMERKRFIPSTEDGEGGHGIYHITVFMVQSLLR